MISAEHYTELLARVDDFRRAPGLGAAELAASIDQAIDQARVLANSAGAGSEEFNQGLFPVLAWADEAIAAAHTWSDEYAWQEHLLQRRYFRTALAGREFFERLQNLTEEQSNLREIYLLCLCMGFQGRYSTADAGAAELADTKMAQYRSIQNYPVRPGTQQISPYLFPEAYPQRKSSAKKTRKQLSKAKLLLIALPPLVVLASAFLMHSSLSTALEQFRQAALL